MSRLIFLNRYFEPDHSATSQLVSDLAFHLSATGLDVHVIASQQLYDDPRASLPKEDMIRGVHVHRVSTTSFGRSALWGRAADYLSYYAAMASRAHRLARAGDILIAKTDPPLTSVIAMGVVALKRNARLVNWLQDLYPETAAQLGVPLTAGFAGSLWTWLRDASLRRAASNIAVGQRMAERVCSRGIARERILVIHNWSDDDQIHPVPADQNPLRREWGLDQNFVAGYSGNLGRAHEFQTVLSAAESLRDHPSIVFLFIGGGYGFDQLRQEIRNRHLDKLFLFYPYQSQDRLKYSLSVPDVHLISLRPQLEGLIVPSKFYGIAAAGRPVISITAQDGEVAQLVRKHACGVVIEPGDGQALAKELAALAKQPCTVAKMGQRARAMLDENFARQQALARWQNLFATLMR